MLHKAKICLDKYVARAYLYTLRYGVIYSAGWSSLVARRAHNPEVTGSNPVPATKNQALTCENRSGFFFDRHLTANLTDILPPKTFRG